MDQKDGASYPPEFAHIAEIVREVKAKSLRIDQEIRNLPPDKGYQYTLRPPGVPPPPKTISRKDRIEMLEEIKGKSRDDAWRQIEDSLKDTHTAEAKSVRDNALEALYPNPYRDMAPEEHQQQRKELRDVEKSQSFMSSLRSSSLVGQTKGDTEKQNPDQARSEVVHPLQDNLDPSRFKDAELSSEQKSQISADHIDQSQQLMADMKSYHQEREQKAPPEKEPSAPNKTITSMSDRFSQSLSYTKAVERTEGPSTPSRDREPDKDRD